MSQYEASHDFNILFRFSLLLNLSTLFLCIVSANFSYLAFSSFAARLSLMACTLLCQAQSVSLHNHPTPYTITTL
jgi:hypothetical protein